MTALLERWRQRPYDALRHAQLALAEYRQFGGLNELARIEVVIADIELDLAANLPFSAPGHGELTLLPFTDRHVADAFTFRGQKAPPCRAGDEWLIPVAVFSPMGEHGSL